MPPEIHDQFTALSLSANRKCQLRRRAKGQCEQCGDPPVPGLPLCASCGITRRVAKRRSCGCSPSAFARRPGAVAKYPVDYVRL